MNKIDVYGVGNALVDIEYHASPERLTELGIEKGVMTLIDENRQNGLMHQLGESHEKMTCGGSAANTIIALAQMGGTTHLDYRVSNDITGQFYTRDLVDSGVQSSIHNKPDYDGVTGKCLVFVTPDADRTMNTFLGISAELDADDVDEDAISRSSYVYLEGYLASSDNTRDAAIRARKVAEAQGVKTALTLSDPNMVKFFGAAMKDMIGDGVDLLFANEDEALELAGTSDFYDAMQKIKTMCNSFAITRGKEGAVVYDGHAMIDIAPNPVEAIDTLGAGDMFAGAFFHGLTSGMSFERSGDLASLASSKIVTQYGPRLEASQTRDLLNSFNSGN